MTAGEQELRQEIERTRDQLGETVEALAAKADVRKRTRDRAAEVIAGAKGRARDAARDLSRRPVPAATVSAVATAAALFLGHLITRRWRTR
jgi:Protein of unknown function (DUF3618)